MLQIKDIRKQYITGELVQTALDGVSLTLRDNEFVAILGPSGSGKTTLLNVIGGLDRYDSGDLVINGISTKKYTDRDWDSYRNHTIGFVFQSYNLIPHQTVLANVELALTISGISRTERRKRAKKALEDVGLGNQIHKKPNQMSGGQMQRVAIARALVNDPDILLADEPTGALDTDTSVQVMELLKKVSENRLVVMVTHNPELAEAYANRIVRVRDGKLIDDTNPYLPENTMEAAHKNMGRASMSWFTALSLSFNNLRTKKARTLLTAFAGSIGIIGIALILSLSTGFQKYIDQIQEDTLSSYPLTIQSETADMGAAMMAMGSMIMGGDDVEPGTVVEQQMIASMFAQIGSNDLESFKTYLEDNYSQIGHTIKTIKYSYGIKPVIFSPDTSDKILQVNPGSLFGTLTGSSAMSAYMDTDVFQELPESQEMLNDQYDVLQGRWPEQYNETVFVLADPKHIPDLVSYSLGLRDMDELNEMMQLVMEGKEAVLDTKPLSFSYEDLLAMEFKLVNAGDMYRYNSEYAVWEDMSSDMDYMRELIASGETLKIVGIVTPKDGASASMSMGIGYTAELTRRVIDKAGASKIVKDQLSDESVNVFTGKEFAASEEDGPKLNFEDMISVDGDMLESAFGMDVDEGAILDLMEDYLGDIVDSMTEDLEPAQKAFSDTLEQLAHGMLTEYIKQNADPDTGKAELALSDAQTIAQEYLAGEQAQALIEPMAKKYSLDTETFTGIYEPLLIAFTASCIASNMELPEADIPETEIPGETEAVQAFEIREAEALAEETEVSEATETTEPSEPTETTESTEPTEGTVPSEPALPDIDMDLDSLSAQIGVEDVASAVSAFMENPAVTAASGAMAGKMVEVMAQEKLMRKLSKFGDYIMRFVGDSFYVDAEKIEGAFQFNMDEDELKRLMDAMSNMGREVATAESNLSSLGYARMEAPSTISIYFPNFADKEAFMDFLDSYNSSMEAAGKEDQVISYTDVTGIMMSSVRTIIDSVSYVLIAFVAVSLVVSSIMIGIITYISVMERTKEIGILRAIGASKGNISQVFNAETFIIGLCSGAIGVGITLLLIVPINSIIHSLTGNPDINAQLPIRAAVVLVILSVILTLIGGLIPSQKAAKKDPVIALRSE
ncbi:MAG: ABC transporter ATP-binding protein/permease [Oscillospiraceae bacterium]|nr:ABC transporter ATP-binding protein/permease [Oscillospiraceae bacterium]